jgi:hypothetical protein
LKDTYAIGLGSLGISQGDDVKHISYHAPVDLNVENYRSIEECIAEIDAQLSAYFETRVSSEATPLVMLSGGLDSVVLLRYLAELDPRTEAITFVYEGSEDNEQKEAQIAAKYYGVKHHILNIPNNRETYLSDTIHLLSESDNANSYSAAFSRWIQNDGRQFDLFRGEDTRLHTPTLDWPSRVGLYVNRSNSFREGLAGKIWTLRKWLTNYPFRRGRNYLGYIMSRTDLSCDLQSYILEKFLRFHLPDTFSRLKGPLYDKLREETSAVATEQTTDNLYRRIISFNFRCQYSENMQWAKYDVSRSKDTVLNAPYYHPSITLACNRVPLSIGLRTKWVSPKKTRSPFPYIDKYVLSSLLEGHAPDELIYRAKQAGSGNEILLIKHLWNILYKPILENWGRNMIDDITDEENKKIIAAYISLLLEHEPDNPEHSNLNYVNRSLVYLSVLNWLCHNPEGDLKKEIINLAKA